MSLTSGSFIRRSKIIYKRDKQKENKTELYGPVIFGMERMETLSDPALCLQDLVTGVTTSSANNDIHGIHHLHDSVSSAVSVSSAITGIMSSSSSASVLGHHLTHDHHHHGVVPHTPSTLHHEPLEKLKRGESFINLF